MSVRRKLDGYTQASDVLELGMASGDTGVMMMQSIVARLFPHLYMTLSELADGEQSDEQAKAQIVEALERERWFEHAYNEQHPPRSDPAEMALYAAVLDGRLTIKRDLAAELEEIAAMQRKQAAWREAQYARLHAERAQALDDLGDDEFDDDDDLDDDDFAN